MASNAEQCAFCGFLSPSVALYVSHLRLVHSTDSTFHVLCNIAGCSLEFRSFSAFNSHVYRWHRAAIGLEHLTGEDTSPSPTQQVLTSHHNISTANSPERCRLSDYEDDDGQHDERSPRRVEDAFALDMYRQTNAEFIMKLSEGRQLSQVAMDDIIQGCREICKQTLCTVKVNVVRALSDAGIDAFSVPGLEDTLSKIPDPFVGLETPYMREKFYKQRMNYVVSCIICTANVML